MNHDLARGPVARGECCVSLLTPVGRGAIATLSVEGAEAPRVVLRLFTPGWRRGTSRPMTPVLADLPPGRIVVGRWASPGVDARSGEEVVVCRVADERVEVHCHGGPAAAAAMIRSLRDAGCVERTWQESLRGGTGSEPGPPCCGPARVAALDRANLAADAIIALADARTDRAAAILLDQYRGALSNEWDRIASLRAVGELSECRTRLGRLLTAADVGFHLKVPWKVTLAGPPNVGKSSLINALLGYGRALVSDQPGTTRDAVTATTALHGWPVELTDTAGLRETSCEVESAGVAITRQRIAEADLIVFVVDSASPSVSPTADLPEAGSHLIVWNKCDVANPPESHQGVRTSAVTGEGIPALVDAIAAQLVPHPPAPGSPVPFLPGHTAAIRAELDSFG